MTQFFIQLLNASIASSWLIGAVLLVRLIIKGRSPRWIACLLWGLVAVRLVIPFSVESPFSLVPETPEITLEFDTESEEASSSTESENLPAVSQMGNTSTPAEESEEGSIPSREPSQEASEESREEISEDSYESEEPEGSEEVSFETSEEASVEESYETSVETSVEDSEEPQESSVDESEDSHEEISEDSEASVPAGVVGNTSTPGNPSGGKGISVAHLASGLWLMGVLILLTYAVVNYVMLKKRVLVFTPDERGFRRCEAIDTPFVLGILRPRIYLPYGLSPYGEPYIIAHEKAHIKRLDHVAKPFAYLVLAIHWFNPLVWLAFVLLCKDIEYACDEKVLKNAAADIRKEYATALLECASKRSFLAACPIAFGEVSVKERVKKTMLYKRPLLWVIIVSVLLCALVAVLFFTAPMDEESAPNTPSEEQTSSEVSTELSTEASTESSTEESSVAEPSEPEESQPDESEPDESEPEVSEPEVSAPPEEPVLATGKETTVKELAAVSVSERGPVSYEFRFGIYKNPEGYGTHPVVIEFPTLQAVDEDGNLYFYCDNLSSEDYIYCHKTRERINVTTQFNVFDFWVSDGRFFLSSGSTTLGIVEYTKDGLVKHHTAEQYQKRSDLCFDEAGKPYLDNGEAGLITLAGEEKVLEHAPLYTVDESGVQWVTYGTYRAPSMWRAKLYGDRLIQTTENSYTIYDLSENTLYRFEYEIDGHGHEKVDCSIKDGETEITHYYPKTFTLGDFTVEAMEFELVTSSDGNVYLMAYFTDRIRLYGIDPGYTPETDPKVPMAPALPADKETKLEKVLSFGIGENGLFSYHFDYPQDPPPEGEEVRPVGVSEPEVFTVDENGNLYILYYQASENARYLFCANTGERIQVSLSAIDLDAAKGRIFVRGGSGDYPFSEIFADGTVKRYTCDQYGSFSRIYFDVN